MLDNGLQALLISDYSGPASEDEDSAEEEVEEEEEEEDESEDEDSGEDENNEEKQVLLDGSSPLSLAEKILYLKT